MDFATAKAILNEVAPDLLIDDPNKALPNTIVVRKSKNGHPFCITLPVALRDGFEEIPERQAIPEQPAIVATDDHPGRPAIPAQPYQPARTIEGQMAESERLAILSAVDQARMMLG